MENVKRESIPERMKVWIGDREGQGYALKSLTYDGTDGDVWAAALENSEGEAQIITCAVRKNGEVERFVFSSRKGFMDLADRLARFANVWVSEEPEPQDENKSRQACDAPDGDGALTDSKP